VRSKRLLGPLSVIAMTAALTAAAPAGPAPKPAKPTKPLVVNAKIVPFAVPAGTTFEYAILDPAGTRIATASYRVVSDEKTQGAVAVRYVGKGKEFSESSSVTFDPKTMHPVRSARKMVSGKDQYDVAVTYATDGINVTEAENGKSQSRSITPDPNVFDFEELMFLLPQLEFAGAKKVYIHLFHPNNAGVDILVITDEGADKVDLGGRMADAERFTFTFAGSGTKAWVKRGAGARLLKYDTGRFVFLISK
jgi:hypothetical protein